MSLWGTDEKGLFSALRRPLITFLGHESSVAFSVRIFTHKAVLKDNVYVCVCQIKHYSKVTCIGYAERTFLQQGCVLSMKLSCAFFLGEINHGLGKHAWNTQHEIYCTGTIFSWATLSINQHNWFMEACNIPIISLLTIVLILVLHLGEEKRTCL